jgi:hypothetical protein
MSEVKVLKSDPVAEQGALRQDVSGVSVRDARFLCVAGDGYRHILCVAAVRVDQLIVAAGFALGLLNSMKSSC